MKSKYQDEKQQRLTIISSNINTNLINKITQKLIPSGMKKIRQIRIIGRDKMHRRLQKQFSLKNKKTKIDLTRKMISMIISLNH